MKPLSGDFSLLTIIFHHDFAGTVYDATSFLRGTIIDLH